VISDTSNHWVCRDIPLASWVADLSSLRHDDRALADWLRAVVDAGERFAVYTVHDAPLIEFRRPDHGPLGSYLELRRKSEGLIDLFHFASSGARAVDGRRFEVTGRMAYFEEGRVTENDVSDLGRLLARLRPADVQVAGSLMSYCPPVLADGPLIDLEDRGRSFWTGKPGCIEVRFEICSDIWLPWVKGFLDEEFGRGIWYDNRPLTERHSPRLNNFLLAVAEATNGAGAPFELDAERTLSTHAYLVSAKGIQLDAQPPACDAALGC
jgi:hypothetical protein